MKFRTRLIFILGIFGLSALLLYPSYKWYFLIPDSDKQLLALSEEEIDKLPPVEKKKVKELKDFRKGYIFNLGLDLKGGAYLVLQVDPDDLKAKLLEKMKPEEVEKNFKKEYAEATTRALEILRNRMDKFGISEPAIRRTIGNRIVVELPGLQNPRLAKEALYKVGRLELKLVDEDFMKELEQKGLTEGGVIKDIDALSNITIPADDELLYVWKNDEYGIPRKAGALVVKKQVIIDGSMIADARPDFDSYGRPVVDFRLTDEGADIFAETTKENIGKRLAIILDGRIKSAPVIRSEIPNGRGEISGLDSVVEAKFLAGILKAGALPVKLKIVEERIIGPKLGQDSIKSGLLAGLWGSLVVMLFMVFYYKIPGFIADFALALNVVLILAVLAGLRGTLTLPGIAGIILTVGMSIDANVIIFERIREEMRAGNKLIDTAVANGYKRAFRTILDANITTLIAAFVLWQYGSSIIKGFGITLFIGIILSMITALFVSRFFLEAYIHIFKIRRLRI